MDFARIPPLALLDSAQLIELTAREHDWIFLFSGGVCVVAEASHWRLIDDNRVVITDEDHGEVFGLKEPVDAAKLVLEKLAATSVSRIELSPVSDLVLSFSNGLTLQFQVGSVGYENWHVYGPDQTHTFAVGGGELCRMVT